MFKFWQKAMALMVGLATSLPLFAQEKAAMADLMRSNGKIYIVVAVCLTILIGLFLYVTSIDRKISRLEKENKNQS
ncbi:MAG: CcmD family protein [Sphingobacteriales bacterium]|jgi:cytochrome c biogenesis protein CcdA|nr:CcmD family protein [Sphingobacteriales bacterium]